MQITKIRTLLTALLLSLACLNSVWASGLVQRVFTDRDGLAATSIRDLTLDDYGFVWAATEQGLYRVSNSKVRRVDKVSLESRLSDDFLTSVVNVERNHLLVSTNATLYLYNIVDNQFTAFGSASLFPHYNGGALVSAARKNAQEWLLLTDNGQIYQLSLSTQSLTLITQLPVDPDVPWRKIIITHDGQMLLANQLQLELLTAQGELVFQFPWTEQDGGIADLLMDAKQRIWLTSTQGVYQIDLGLKQVAKVPELPDWSTLIVEDSDGFLWLATRAGLIKWSPDTHHKDNFQQELKSQANMEVLKAMLTGSSGLMWVGGSGDGLALLASKPDFLLEAYTDTAPYQLYDAMTWSVYADDMGQWFGSSELSFIPRGSNKAQAVQIDGFKPNEYIYEINHFIDQHLLLSTTSGLYVVDEKKLTGTNFATWAGGADNFKNKLVYKTYYDPLITDRIWIATATGLYYWQPEMTEPKAFNLDTSLANSTEPARPTIRSIIRAADGKLWLGGKKTFGYVDAQGVFHDQRALFSGLQAQPIISHMEEMSPGVFWFGTYEKGLFEYRQQDNTLTALTSEWQVSCSSIFFIQKTSNANLIGCADSLIRQDRQTGKIAVFNQLDGFISDEMNEGAFFYYPNDGFYIGTPEGVMLLDADTLVNRITDDHVMLESVSIYYKDTTHVSLLPKAKLVIQPDASMVSFQITNLDYLDDSPIQFKYRLLQKGDDDGRYVLLQGESQINLAGLAAGEYSLEVLNQVNGIWSSRPFTYSFKVEQYWWQSQGFKGLVIFLLSLVAISVAWYRQRQVRTFVHMNQALLESDDRLRQSLRGSDSDLWEWRSETQQFHLENSGGVLGDHGEVIVRGLYDIPVHPDDADRVVATWDDMIRGKTDRFEAEYRFRRQSGQWGWLRVRGRPVKYNKETRAIERVAGIYSDITEQRRLEDEVNLLAQAFENTSEGVLILDADENIKVSNHAAQQIIGLASDALVGKVFTQLLANKNLSTHPNTNSSTDLSPNLSTNPNSSPAETSCAIGIKEMLENEHSWTGEREISTAYNTCCPVWLNVSLMHSGVSKQTHYVVVFSDITERKRTEADLRRLANYDVLTGLPNRSLFSSKLLQSIQDAERGNEKLALLFLDLDRFKHVNDSYGHSMGDALLVEASNRLQNCMTSEHTLCRFGGDEFVILMRHANNQDNVNHLAEQLLTQILAPFKLYGREFFISTSIGISIWPDDATQPEALIKNADLAMYHAKDEGRGNFQYYSSERNAEALYHLRLEADLRKALERQEFELYYQPQIDILRNDSLIGMEALLRWRHPKDGFIRPDIFIKVAESCGLIIDIDRWVLRQACLHGARWAKQYDKAFKLSVNISAVHFRQVDFIDGVKNILAETQIDPANLSFEITEGVLMKELYVAKSYLRQLKQLGIEVAIDDFGTGYSSLAYLRHFEVNTLKIDRSFLIDIATNTSDQAIVSSIIELARNLKLNVVAEGIETLEQLEQVFSRGCYVIQGYYFAKPMPLTEMDRYMGVSSTEQCQSSQP